MTVRVARALSCSLALHALAWTALREGPSLSPAAALPTVELIVAYEIITPFLSEKRMAMTDPEWMPQSSEPLPPDQAPEIEPPDVAYPPEEIFIAEDAPREAVPSPYWEEVRRELARAMRWPAGWRAQTNVEARFYALSEVLLPLAPPPDTSDPIQMAVRKVVERVARRAARPPEEVVGRAMRLLVCFDPDTERNNQ